ncbi:hypothetical protein KJ815_07815, partial [bacterium]|nr:hypothetical protein [bacterium]
HNHVLPGLDDGATDLSESLRMLTAAARQGITHVGCTPHGNDRINEKTDLLYQSVFLQVKEAAKREGIPVELALALELMLGVDILQTLHLPLATYHGAGKYFLIEFPWHTPFEILLNAIRACMQSEMIPIIAHYERYEQAIKKPEQPHKVRHAGAVITMDAGSLVGQFGAAMTRRSRQLLNWGCVDVLASDAHDDMEHGFCLRQGFEAAAAIIGEAEAQKLVSDNPRRIWEGTPWPRAEEEKEEETRTT